MPDKTPKISDTAECMRNADVHFLIRAVPHGTRGTKNERDAIANAPPPQGCKQACPCSHMHLTPATHPRRTRPTHTSALFAPEHYVR
jgi:hypothetical protein